MARHPAWYHEDNLFETRRRLDWAHRPIVDLALDVLSKGRPKARRCVLDLGCGNGALLEKIHRARPDAIPYGIDLVGSRIEHAKILLPRHAENLHAGDLFGRHPFRERRWSLVLLSPRRLTEAGPRKAARLLRWIAERTDHLLVYAYGTGLVEHDGLEGFARSVGIELRPGTRRAARAALAALPSDVPRARAISARRRAAGSSTSASDADDPRSSGVRAPGRRPSARGRRRAGRRG